MAVSASDIERLEAEEKALREKRNEITRAITTKVEEIRATRLAYAEANPHPWIGKRVTRQKRHGYGGKTQTKIGTVVAYDPLKHRALRELSTRSLKPGDPIVVIDSGLTGWTLDQHRYWSGAVRAPETDWELVEELKP